MSLSDVTMFDDATTTMNDENVPGATQSAWPGATQCPTATATAHLGSGSGQAIGGHTGGHPQLQVGTAPCAGTTPGVPHQASISPNIQGPCSTIPGRGTTPQVPGTGDIPPDARLPDNQTSPLPDAQGNLEQMTNFEARYGPARTVPTRMAAPQATAID